MDRLSIILPAAMLASLFSRSAAGAADADVVVIVDTSFSMKEPGMDPQRTSLLVAKLFSDVVPGRLAIARLLDITRDRDLIPSTPSAKTVPCTENPSQTCTIVEPTGDWDALVEQGRFGIESRPARGDLAFKKKLDRHLEQTSGNSLFELAFRAATGELTSHGNQGESATTPKTVIWLSDGRAENPGAVVNAVEDLKKKVPGVLIEAVVFGKGTTELAERMGLPARKTTTPRELMQTFAAAFRRVVRAPYEVDAEVASQPTFKMMRNVSESWIVIYGDESLKSASLTGPSGKIEAKDAEDAQSGAGAYRVAFIQNPEAGEWTVSASGGGPNVAYAVVQHSALVPSLIAPETTTAGSKVPLVAALRIGDRGEIFTSLTDLGVVEFEAEVEGQKIKLSDDGTNGDQQAGDGRFSGLHTFATVGEIEVIVSVRANALDSKTRARVKVSGQFISRGDITVDLGELRAGATACKPIILPVEQQGDLPLVATALENIESGHALEVKTPHGILTANGPSRTLGPGAPLELCLKTAADAPSSSGDGKRWLGIGLEGGGDAHTVAIKAHWKVVGLPFWQRWAKVIAAVLIALFLAFIAFGYISPKRFSPTFAVSFAPEREELDDQPPMPIKTWRGVGIGFYRNARAFLHADYRVSGDARNALVGLHANEGGRVIVLPCGVEIFQATIDGDWKSIGEKGQRANAGDVFRIRETGPFFRISSKLGAR